MTPKILCLHGFYQNAGVFGRKCANVLKKIQKLGYEIDIMDGPLKLMAKDLPFECPPQPEPFDLAKDFVKINNEDSYARGWYTVTPLEEDKPFIDPITELSLHPKKPCCPECPSEGCLMKTPPKLFNLTLSIKTVRQYILEHGPYRGIIGFSQGGCIANSLLFANDEKLEVGWIISIASHLLGTPLTPGSVGTDGALRLQNQNHSIPLLLVTGERDDHIPKAQTLECKEFWSPNAQILIHDGGHCVPQKSAYVQVILEFIQNSDKTSS